VRGTLVQQGNGLAQPRIIEGTTVPTARTELDTPENVTTSLSEQDRQIVLEAINGIRERLDQIDEADTDAVQRETQSFEEQLRAFGDRIVAELESMKEISAQQSDAPQSGTEGNLNPGVPADVATRADLGNLVSTLRSASDMDRDDLRANLERSLESRHVELGRKINTIRTEISTS